MRRFYVYILASKSRVLHTGITNDLWHRVWDHKNHVFPCFTSKYKVHRLVYFETFKYVDNAIKRKKEIQEWMRHKEIALIERENPTWEDLSAEWFDGKNVKTGQLCAEDSRSFAALRMTNSYRVDQKLA